jgi:hypothetical protein
VTQAPVTQAPAKPPATHAAAPTVAPAAVAPAPSHAATQSGCYPHSSKGTCYEPGEYCPKADHGESGIAGDGKSITCEDVDGWRWED